MPPHPEIMNAGAAMRSTQREHFLIGLARAFGGAIFFSLPLLMTMEMWQLGFSMCRGRLLLFMLLTLPMLERLSHYSGFEETHSVTEDAKDAIVAFGIGVVASLIILALFRVIDATTALDEAIGKVALQAIPASMGAVLANSQLSGVETDRRRKVSEERQEEAGYAGQMFLMMAGAVFFAFNVAPTEEMVLIAYRMTAWHAFALVAVSIALMHAFVFAVNFRGQHDVPEGTPWWSVFLRYSAMGYALSLAVSAYVLWTFGRFDDRAFEPFVILTIVLGFPAGLGAAAARLFL